MNVWRVRAEVTAHLVEAHTRDVDMDGLEVLGPAPILLTGVTPRVVLLEVDVEASLHIGVDDEALAPAYREALQAVVSVKVRARKRA